MHTIYDLVNVPQMNINNALKYRPLLPLGMLPDFLII